jgi:hypothetical protein
LVISGPVPGREGPHSIGVPIRYPCFIYNTYLYVAEKCNANKELTVTRCRSHSCIKPLLNPCGTIRTQSFYSKSCLGHAFPRSPPSWSCCPVRTLIDHLSRSVHAAMLSASSCANGAIATGTIIVATRYFQESSNRILF